MDLIEDNQSARLKKSSGSGFSSIYQPYKNPLKYPERANKYPMDGILIVSTDSMRDRWKEMEVVIREDDPERKSRRDKKRMKYEGQIR